MVMSRARGGRAASSPYEYERCCMRPGTSPTYYTQRTTTVRPKIHGLLGRSSYSSESESKSRRWLICLPLLPLLALFGTRIGSQPASGRAAAPRATGSGPGPVRAPGPGPRNSQAIPCVPCSLRRSGAVRACLSDAWLRGACTLGGVAEAGCPLVRVVAGGGRPAGRGPGRRAGGGCRHATSMLLHTVRAKRVEAAPAPGSKRVCEL